MRISEAPSYGQTVVTYDAGSTGALAYRAAAQEIAKRATTTGQSGGGESNGASPQQSHDSKHPQQVAPGDGHANPEDDIHE